LNLCLPEDIQFSQELTKSLHPNAEGMPGLEAQFGNTQAAPSTVQDKNPLMTTENSALDKARYAAATLQSSLVGSLQFYLRSSTGEEAA